MASASWMSSLRSTRSASLPQIGRRDRGGQQGGGDDPGEGGLRAVQVGDDPRAATRRRRSSRGSRRTSRAGCPRGTRAPRGGSSSGRSARPCWWARAWWWCWTWSRSRGAGRETRRRRQVEVVVGQAGVRTSLGAGVETAAMVVVRRSSVARGGVERRCGDQSAKTSWARRSRAVADLGGQRPCPRGTGATVRTRRSPSSTARSTSPSSTSWLTWRLATEMSTRSTWAMSPTCRVPRALEDADDGERALGAADVAGDAERRLAQGAAEGLDRPQQRLRRVSRAGSDGMALLCCSTQPYGSMLASSNRCARSVPGTTQRGRARRGPGRRARWRSGACVRRAAARAARP